jgi:hypothetical protein
LVIAKKLVPIANRCQDCEPSIPSSTRRSASTAPWSPDDLPAFCTTLVEAFAI